VAAALRLSQPVVAAGLGDFGQHVARLLVSEQGWGEVTADAWETALADGSVLVVVMWHPQPALCERLDAVSFATGTPWLPVVADHPRIRVGPWGAAPHGPCYDCYLRRKRQHEVRHAASKAIEDAYDQNPARGVAGYLPHHARLAAGLAGISVRTQLAQGVAAVAGQAQVANIVTGKTATHRVIACHGCPRCGAGHRLGGQIPLAELVKAAR
jgi:bacteriocin biosynthesis cyclodehydratase domain-containing protein